MEYMVTTRDNQVILTLTGKLYVHDAGIIREEMIEKIEAGYHQVIVKLAGLTYIDSAGLGVLVTLHKVSRKRHGLLVLTGIQGMVKELLRRTRLDKILHLEEAV